MEKKELRSVFKREKYNNKIEIQFNLEYFILKLYI